MTSSRARIPSPPRAAGVGAASAAAAALLPLLCLCACLQGSSAAAGEGAGTAPPAEGAVAPALSPAEQALRSGRYEEAVSAFEEWTRADPGVPAAWRGWSEALAAQGKRDEALAVLRKAPGFEKSPALLCAAGRVLLRVGKLDEARQSFEAAARLDPSSVEATNRLGECLDRRGLRDDARRRWERVVEIYEGLSPEEAERLRAEDFVEMGLALVGLNRWKEAQDVMFAQAKEKDPDCPAAFLESARALLEKYNFPDSRDELREAIDRNPRYADALALLADNLLEDFQKGSQRYELVDKDAARALAVDPRHSHALMVRGALWLSDGNISKAEDDLSKAVESDPSSLRARGILAACHYLEADEAALKRDEEEALAVNPRGAEFFHTLGASLENKFRYPDVVRFCDRALALDPGYWPAYATLAIGCLRTGDEARGRQYLEKSWGEDRFNPWVYNTRLLLKYMDSDYRELKTDHFIFKFPKADYDALVTYLVPLMDQAYERLAAHYKTTLSPPIHIEAFSEHKWFSARTIGLEGLAASGACFGNLVTLATARALPMNWGAVAWHEFTHVVTLQLTGFRVPRWLTEGCSTFEEGRDHPRWARNFEREIADAWGSGRLLPIAELDFGFSKPKYPNQILISYFQGCLIVRYVSERWGFDAVLKILEGYKANLSTAQIFKDALGLGLEEFDRAFFEYVAKWVEANGYEPTLALDSVEKLRLASQADPKDVRKLVDLAWAYHCNRIDVDVPLTVAKILELDPSSGDALAIQGLQDLVEKKRPQAKERLEKALEAGTRFRFRVHSALAAIARKDGDKAALLEHLEKAREISPRAGAAVPPRGSVYEQLAELYKEAGDEDRSIQTLEELCRYSPEDGKSLQAIADHYLKKEDEASRRKAFDALEELIFINPFVKPVHESLARVAADLGADDIVIREWEFLLKLPDPDRKAAFLALAKAHLSKGRKVEAAAAARKLLEVEPESAEGKRILQEAGR